MFESSNLSRDNLSGEIGRTDSRQRLSHIARRKPLASPRLAESALRMRAPLLLPMCFIITIMYSYLLFLFSLFALLICLFVVVIVIFFVLLCYVSNLLATSSLLFVCFTTAHVPAAVRDEAVEGWAGAGLEERGRNKSIYKYN